MKLFAMILVYLFSGDVKIEREHYPTLEACIEAGEKRTVEITNDPRFEAAMGGWCVQVTGEKS